MIRPLSFASQPLQVSLLLLLNLLPRSGWAQFDRVDPSEPEIPRIATGRTSMPINELRDPEVVRSERGVINPYAAQTVLPLEEALDPDKYICNRGDQFELNFWGQQNFRLRVTVDMEGHTFISKIGYVDLVGKTLTEARRTVKSLVARYYPGLKFDLSLIHPRTFLLHVVGFVSKPGIYPATPVDRVETVLNSAGGITGSRRRITLKHKNGKTDHADLLLYEITGDTKYNPFVIDGDIIEIPFAEVTVTVAGPVKRSGVYELIDTKDLEELVFLAGGLRSMATHALPIRIVHRDKQERNIEVQITSKAGAPLPKVTLTDQDMVFIPSSDELQKSVLLIGPFKGGEGADEVTMVRRITYFKGATVRTLIERTQGIGASADLRNSFIRHPDGTITPVDLDKLLLLRDFSEDKEVDIGDHVTIPQKRQAIAVGGSVINPSLIPYNPRLGPTAYINLAGGPSKNAQRTSKFRLITASGVNQKLSEHDVLVPGDTILVPERTFSRAEIAQLVMGAASLLISTISVTLLVLRH